MRNEEVALRTWVENNLELTTASMSRHAARRWQRLLMRDHQAFYRLALFGFVIRRCQERGDDSYPKDEFLRFCGEFLLKLDLVLKGRGAVHSVPIFLHVGEKTMRNFYGRKEGLS